MGEKSNYEILKEKSIKSCYPIHVVFFNEKCQLNCRFCYRKYVNKKNKRNLNMVEIEHLVENLKELGTITFELSGGEPLLIPNFRKIFILIRNYGFKVILTTNGLQLDYDKAAFILNNGIESISFSVHGANKQTHNAIVNKDGAFSKTIKWAKYFNQFVDVSINFVITKNNYMEMEKANILFNKMNLKVNFIYNLVPYQNKPHKMKNIWLNKKELFKVFDSFSKITNNQLSEKDDDNLLCNAGRNQLAIDIKGDVYPCIQFPQKAGNIRKLNIKKIWDNSKLMKKCRNINKSDYKKMDLSYLEFGQKCIANNYVWHGNYFKEDPYNLKIAKWEKEWRRINSI
ncbi:MAG: radical SAM protein [Candidatus Mcinerneyibacterium aminivorans]|uniref:Radical SAM protein n=1 Tax=Candidatus Mcinerneyibacterium aminivorans TaxID=2703815 RepID=A0A5D0M9A5_9BACT|nr:MAG: radical SAM protein [Candidatus Mcinerneyibacterium aminivorans]